MVETKGHSLESIEQKYTEKQLNAKALGKWRRLGGQSFGLRTRRPAGPACQDH